MLLTWGVGPRQHDKLLRMMLGRKREHFMLLLNDGLRAMPDDEVGLCSVGKRMGEIGDS